MRTEIALLLGWLVIPVPFLIAANMSSPEAFTADRIVLSLIVLTVLNYLPLGALLVAYDQCGRNRQGLMVGALLVALVCMVTPVWLLGSSDGQAAVAVFFLPVLLTPIGVAVYFSVHLGQRLFCGVRMRTKDSHGKSP